MNYIVEFKGEFNIDPEVYAVLTLDGKELPESKVVLIEDDLNDLNTLRIKLSAAFISYLALPVTPAP